MIGFLDYLSAFLAFLFLPSHCAADHVIPEASLLRRGSPKSDDSISSGTNEGLLNAYKEFEAVDHIVSPMKLVSPAAERAVWNGVTDHIPWKSDAPIEKITSTLDKVALEFWRQIDTQWRFLKPNPYPPPSGGLLVACLYLGSSKKIYAATIPYDSVKTQLQTEFEKDINFKDLKGIWHAEHHVIAMALKAGEKFPLPGSAGYHRRYLAVYGINSKEKEWKAPCKGFGDYKGCQSFLKGYGIAFHDGYDDLQNSSSESLIIGSSSQASPPNKKQKNKRRSLMKPDPDDTMIDIGMVQEFDNYLVKQVKDDLDLYISKIWLLASVLEELLEDVVYSESDS